MVHLRDLAFVIICSLILYNVKLGISFPTGSTLNYEEIKNGIQKEVSHIADPIKQVEKLTGIAAQEKFIHQRTKEERDKFEAKADENLKKANSAEKDKVGSYKGAACEDSLKSLACAMDCRYAVESFSERFNKDPSFSVDTVKEIMSDLRQIIDDRNKSLTRIVEHFARASVLKNKTEADLKVLTTWVELQNMELDNSSLIQHDLDLGMAIIRISEAEDDRAALKVWKKDKETVWRKRIYIRNVRVKDTTVSSTTIKAGSSVSELSITPDKKLMKNNPPTPQPRTVKKSTKKKWIFQKNQEFLLLYLDWSIIRNLSNIPDGCTLENIIINWNYYNQPAAEYIRNIIYILPNLHHRVTNQYHVCAWILFSHKFCSGIEQLIEFIKGQWIGETWPKKVDRFCSRFDLFFWKLPSNRRLHPKFKLPPNCKLGKEDRNLFLSELGALDQDAKIVAEGLFLHFNKDDVTCSTSPASTT